MLCVRSSSAPTCASTRQSWPARTQAHSPLLEFRPALCISKEPQAGFNAVAALHSASVVALPSCFTVRTRLASIVHGAGKALQLRRDEDMYPGQHPACNSVGICLCREECTRRAYISHGVLRDARLASRNPQLTVLVQLCARMHTSGRRSTDRRRTNCDRDTWISYSNSCRCGFPSSIAGPNHKRGQVAMP